MSNEERIVQKAVQTFFEDFHSMAKSKQRIANASERIAQALELLVGFYYDDFEDDEPDEPENFKNFPRLDEYL